MLPPPVSRATLAISDYGELRRLLDDLLVDLNSDSDLSLASTKRHKTPEWASLLEDLIDEQVALLHELVALQEEAAMLQNATYFQHHPSIATLLARRVVACSGTATSNDARWLARLVKRVAVAVSRAPKELPAADNKGGSTWSLTLWRNMTLLHAVLHADRRVGEVTLERTKDLIEYVWLARLLLLGLITRDALA
ncbi:hypothetical protein PINS_up021989 [Pythium insidiosum]|nr:hypothetical protein PINS_up021989 [Pythium insidiosum]